MLTLLTLNHLLNQQPTLRGRMSRHAGRTATIRALPFSVTFAIADDGFVVGTDAIAQTTLSFPLSLGPRLALRDEAAYREIDIQGDADFAADLGMLLKDLRWDATEDLSRVVGDVLANRLARLGSRLFGPGGELIHRLGENLLENWTYEAPALARPDALASFSAEVDTLRDDAARLEKRLALLQRRLSGPVEKGAAPHESSPAGLS